MTKGDVITIEGLDWYQQEIGKYVLCHVPKGVQALITSAMDGGYDVIGYVIQGDDFDLFDGRSWFVSLDDAMKAVAAWLVTLRLQGKIKEEDDGD